MPVGVRLTEQVGDEYKGIMTVKMGPATVKYNGTVKIEEADEEARRAVLKADGKDACGQGTTSATITSTLHEENGGESTHVHVQTDMRLTGRVAQFGGGMHQDVAEKIMGRFAECLEKEVVGGEDEEEPPPAAFEAASSAEAEPPEDGLAEGEEQPRRRIIQQDREVEPLDLGEASRKAVMKRVRKAAPVAAGAVALVIVIWLLRRKA